MDRSTWKKHERDWALRMPTRKGQITQRIPVTGRHSADVPDIDHSDFAIEVKAGKVVSSRTLKGLDQAVRASKATQPNKIPVLCQSNKTEGQRDLDHLVTMRYEDWYEMARIYLNNTEFKAVDTKDLTI